MDSRKEIAQYLNEVIADQQGMPLTSNDLFVEAGLDSLGLTFFLMEVDTKYALLKDIPDGQEYESLNLGSITFKDLVNLCKKALAK